MRLNKNTYPIFYKLDEGNAMNFPIDEFFFTELFSPKKHPLERAKDATSIAESAIELYKQSAHTYYLTKPFVSAIEKALPKITENKLHISNPKSDCATMIVEGGVVVYLINPSDLKLKLTLFSFSKESLTAFAFVTNEGGIIGNFPVIRNGVLIDDKQGLHDWVQSMMTAIYFIQNCEIDTVILKPNQKHRDMGVKYFNEYKSEVTILDCKWFTELIRTTPFTVNGFFRWQPCGVKNSKRKLIWIEPFEKKGYHRKARKETANI